MKRRKWGRIINICSAHSLRASPFKSAYVSAKHGLAGFTKSVALELAEAGVTSNAVSPGFVWTPLVEKQIPDLARSENITRGRGQARDPVATADQSVRDRAGGGGACRVPGERCGRLHHRRQLQHRRRLDGAVTGLARSVMPAPVAGIQRTINLACAATGLDGRDKHGHDGGVGALLRTSSAPNGLCGDAVEKTGRYGSALRRGRRGDRGLVLIG